MATTAVVYKGQAPIKTRWWVHVETLGLFLVTLATAALQYAKRPGDRGEYVIVLLWMVAIAVFTKRILAVLEQLERQHGEPTPPMEALFQVAIVVPILGYVPLMMLIRHL